MKKVHIFVAAVALLASAAAVNAQTAPEKPVAEVPEAKAPAAAEKKTSAVKQEIKNHFKLYGFVRNYFAYDNRESVSGTGDLYYWLPKDRALNAAGEDMNEQNQFRFLSLTTRIGINIFDYKVKNVEFGGKIETDFYAGLDKTKGSGTAQLRLRQAYATVKFCELGKNHNAFVNILMGQAWHPMAADLPDIFSLESGAPFNAFSRTPQVTIEYAFTKAWSFTGSALWQMQYCSTGPNGSSMEYIKYGCVPEFYFGFNFKKGGFLGRVGMDVLSIKPRHTASITDPDGQPTTVKVNDRISTCSPFVYLQYTKDKFAVKAKTIYGSAGEHMNLMSGYAVTDKSDDYCWQYAPLHSSSTWLTLTYGKKFKGAVMLGYIENLGTTEKIYCDEGQPVKGSIYFQPNGFSNLTRMARFQPELTYNIGKFFTLGLEYMLTAVNYASDEAGTTIFNDYGLGTNDLHWILNHRVQAMVKFTF